MFCSKCGKQLPDDAVFCSGCGNPVADTQQAAPVAPRANTASLPPILKRLFEQIVGFFTKKDPVGVVSHSITDSTWSGAILLGFGAIVTAMASMVNFNQTINMLYKEVTGTVPDSISEIYPSWTTLGLSLLSAVVIALVTVGMLFVTANFIAKKPLSLCGAVNMVAYASLPLIGAFLLNMILGLIWVPLAIALTAVAALATILILYASFRKIGGFEKAPVGCFMIVGATVTVFTMLFTYIWINAGIEATVEKSASFILALLSGLFGGGSLG